MEAMKKRFLFKKGKKVNLVFLDTMIFIYHFERNKRYFPLTTMIFNLIEKGDLNGIASVVSLVEILTGALRLKQKDLAEQYKIVLTSFPNLSLKEINTEIAEKAAELRAEFNLQTPDAIQLATSVASKADYFLTNDQSLKKIKGVDLLILKELIQ